MSETVTRLEERYRRLLRVLPADYRARWQDDMVSSFLASMHTDDEEQADYLAEYGRPSWSETASVLALAVRLRLPAVRLALGGVGAPPRNVLWGGALRLVALSGLLVFAVSAVTTVGTWLWSAGRLGWLPPPPSEYLYLRPSGVWQTVVGAANLLWLPAYLALLIGARRVSQLLAVVATAIYLIGRFPLMDPDAPFIISDVAYTAVGVLPALALVAFHREAPPVRARPWLIALGVGIAAHAVLLAVMLPADLETFPLLDGPGLDCLVLVGAAVAHLLGRGLGGPSWSLALALLAAVVLGLRAATLNDYVTAAPGVQRQTLFTLGALEAGAVLAVTVPLVLLAVRALRRLPSRAAR
jgi:hypothetical protein